MSTAAAAETGPTPDETIGRTVRALRSAYEVDSQDLARHLGISRQALYNRLNGDARWLAREVAVLAQFFGCEIADFYTGQVRISGDRRTPTNTQASSDKGPVTRGVSPWYRGNIAPVVPLFPHVRTPECPAQGRSGESISA